MGQWFNFSVNKSPNPDTMALVNTSVAPVRSSHFNEAIRGKEFSLRSLTGFNPEIIKSRQFEVTRSYPEVQSVLSREAKRQTVVRVLDQKLKPVHAAYSDKGTWQNPLKNSLDTRDSAEFIRLLETQPDLAQGKTVNELLKQAIRNKDHLVVAKILEIKKPDIYERDGMFQKESPLQVAKDHGDSHMRRIFEHYDRTYGGVNIQFHRGMA